jgi:hypothetical protein
MAGEEFLEPDFGVEEGPVMVTNSQLIEMPSPVNEDHMMSTSLQVF